MDNNRLHKRMGKELRAMDTIVRYFNNEDYQYGWLMNGVADGDAEAMDDTELGYEYEDSYEEIREYFLKLIERASADALEEGYDLFCIDKKEWMRW